VAHLTRGIAIDVSQHVTNLERPGKFILTSDAERLVYLDLLRNNAALHHLSRIGYRLMFNHVHLIVISDENSWDNVPSVPGLCQRDLHHL
jgi:hypothetical protein